MSNNESLNNQDSIYEEAIETYVKNYIFMSLSEKLERKREICDAFGKTEDEVLDAINEKEKMLSEQNKETGFAQSIMRENFRNLCKSKPNEAKGIMMNPAKRFEYPEFAELESVQITDIFYEEEKNREKESVRKRNEMGDD